ncbi:flavin reductase family protein [Parafrigoribacterium mesophilum]|uniref:flavin reductase family protein n=1 Tax=Parafrigoribacterium mesophilum TaxID=433646 RepID=UPI0031FE2105
MDAESNGLNPHRVDAGQLDDTDRALYQWLNGRTAKGVGIISCVHRGHDYAATVTDFLSVSYDPPTMLVSLYSLSRIAEAVDASGIWTLSLLTGAQRPIADALSEAGAPLVALLDNVPHFRREAGSPAIIADALAWFELRTVAAHPVATHTLVVGEVSWMGRFAGAPPDPLVRYESEYRAR